jgi:hypothetical protein
MRPFFWSPHAPNAIRPVAIRPVAGRMGIVCLIAAGLVSSNAEGAAAGYAVVAVTPRATSLRSPNGAGGVTSGITVESQTIVDAAWSLAQKVYTSEKLRPVTLRESDARALAGELPAEADARAKELFEVARAIRIPADAASLRLLASLAQSLQVRGLLVVFAEAASPAVDSLRKLARASASGVEARSSVQMKVFLPAAGAFDAASYVVLMPSTVRVDGATAFESPWLPVMVSLETRFAESGRVQEVAVVNAPTIGHSDAHAKPAGDGSATMSFYKSPWFWGALGAAVVLGGVAFAVTRPNDTAVVRLRAEVPQ